MKSVFDNDRNVLLIVDANDNVVYEIPRHPETGEAWKTEEEAIEYGNQFIETIMPNIVGAVTEDDIRETKRQLLEITRLKTEYELTFKIQILESAVIGETNGLLSSEQIRQKLFAYVTNQATIDQILQELTESITDTELQISVKKNLLKGFLYGMVLYALSQIYEYEGKNRTDFDKFKSDIFAKIQEIKQKLEQSE